MKTPEPEITPRQSRRDKLAVIALQAILSHVLFDQTVEDNYVKRGGSPERLDEFAAFLAYDAAEAMLAERTRRLHFDGRPELIDSMRTRMASAPLPQPGATVLAMQPDLLETAWGIIANAGGGDWSKESKDWQEAAKKWRDSYHLGLKFVRGWDMGTEDKTVYSTFVSTIHHDTVVRSKDAQIAELYAALKIAKADRDQYVTEVRDMTEKNRIAQNHLETTIKNFEDCVKELDRTKAALNDTTKTGAVIVTLDPAELEKVARKILTEYQQGHKPIDKPRVGPTVPTPEGYARFDHAANVGEELLLERGRQISVEGFSPELDDLYTGHQLPRAAACYAMAACGTDVHIPPSLWPWPSGAFKDTNPRRDLVKAGALIIAAIESVDRKANAKPA